MSNLERRLRLTLFFSVFFAYIFWSGWKMLLVRLIDPFHPWTATRLARHMTVVYNRWLLRWAIRAARLRLVLEGAPPQGTGFIFASNHQSVMDSVVMTALFGDNNPLFVAKEAVRYGIPNVSPAARFSRHAFVSRKKGDKAQIEEVERLGRRLVPERASVVIFPEGTRSRTGALGVMKTGGMAALLRASPEARVVPVALDGPGRAATFASLLRTFVGVEVRVRIGPPVDPRTLPPAPPPAPAPDSGAAPASGATVAGAVACPSAPAAPPGPPATLAQPDGPSSAERALADAAVAHVRAFCAEAIDGWRGRPGAHAEAVYG